jgi:hypothetical protein
MWGWRGFTHPFSAGLAPMVAASSTACVTSSPSWSAMQLAYVIRNPKTHRAIHRDFIEDSSRPPTIYSHAQAANPNSREVRRVARFEIYRDEGGEYCWALLQEYWGPVHPT